LIEFNELDEITEFGVPVIQAEKYLSVIFTLGKQNVLFKSDCTRRDASVAKHKEHRCVTSDKWWALPKQPGAQRSSGNQAQH